MIGWLAASLIAAAWASIGIWAVAYKERREREHRGHMDRIFEAVVAERDDLRASLRAARQNCDDAVTELRKMREERDALRERLEIAQREERAWRRRAEQARAVVDQIGALAGEMSLPMSGPGIDAKDAAGNEPTIPANEPALSGSFAAEPDRPAKRQFIVRDQNDPDTEREVWAWHVNEAAILYAEADRSAALCGELPQTVTFEVGQLGSAEWKLVRVEATVWSTSTVIGSRQGRPPLNPGRSDARPPLGRDGSGVARGAGSGEEGADDA